MSNSRKSTTSLFLSPQPPQIVTKLDCMVSLSHGVTGPLLPLLMQVLIMLQRNPQLAFTIRSSNGSHLLLCYYPQSINCSASGLEEFTEHPPVRMKAVSLCSCILPGHICIHVLHICASPGERLEEEMPGADQSHQKYLLNE